MKQMPFKISVLIFLTALLSGFYLRLPLLDNLIRSFVIYLIFSAITLVIMLVYNQSVYNNLKATLQNDALSEIKGAPKQKRTKTAE